MTDETEQDRSGTTRAIHHPAPAGVPAAPAARGRSCPVLPLQRGSRGRVGQGARGHHVAARSPQGARSRCPRCGGQPRDDAARSTSPRSSKPHAPDPRGAPTPGDETARAALDELGLQTVNVIQLGRNLSHVRLTAHARSTTGGPAPRGRRSPRGRCGRRSSAIVVTYARLDPGELYHVSSDGLAGGLSRALVVRTSRSRSSRSRSPRRARRARPGAPGGSAARRSRSAP